MYFNTALLSFRVTCRFAAVVEANISGFPVSVLGHSERCKCSDSGAPAVYAREFESAEDKELIGKLLGKTGVANCRIAYAVFQEVTGKH